MLQSFNEENFPLRKYIIDVDTHIDPPPYVKPGHLYDLSDLTCELVKLPPLPVAQNTTSHKQTQKDGKRNGNEFDVRLFLSSIETPPLNARIANQCKSVDMLKNEWPELKLVELNDSQYAAFKAALSQQFVIIQGPPGECRSFFCIICI